MCCFSGDVTVSSTSIFARDAGKDRQFLIYAMSASSENDVAMILPLPVPDNPGDDAVKFIDLSGYPTIFDDLYKFVTFGDGIPLGLAGGDLAVQEVGAFEASFVPRIADFARLDRRFQLPAGTWEKLPAYRDHGFAVFKLKAGNREIHPMAFSFPRRDASTLFFPTVHIHDGQVHEVAEFNHQLYAQVGERRIPQAEEWNESKHHAGHKIDIKRAAGIIAGDQHVYSRQIEGEFPNQDTLLKFG